ncbi:hypothetical protein CEXT_576931 [Caerostris extrusa]|uniref:Uncharacterized protein n=1 Tax=Caerostris extrusa TaxID=172846 RepID=A0AAV4XKG5_CAEEX|nr:hypothetical protein CEXT_576931 [Caerostris extrusa]
MRATTTVAEERLALCNSVLDRDLRLLQWDGTGSAYKPWFLNSPGMWSWRSLCLNEEIGRCSKGMEREGSSTTKLGFVETLEDEEAKKGGMELIVINTRLFHAT